MATPKKEKAPEIEIPSALPLARLCLFLGETQRQIQRLADIGAIPPAEKRGLYDFGATARGAIAYYKAKADAVPEGKAADQARQAKADADKSEIELAKEKEEICLMSDTVALWEDAVVKMRLAIQADAKIPATMKNRVIEIIQSIELDTEKFS